MKVKKLIEALSKLNPDLEVILSADAEGNSFSEVEELGIYHFNAEDREIYRNDELEDGEELNAVVLWPN